MLKVIYKIVIVRPGLDKAGQGKWNVVKENQ